MENLFAVGFVGQSLGGYKYFYGDRSEVEKKVQPFWKLVDSTYSTIVTIYTYPTEKMMIKELNHWKKDDVESASYFNVKNKIGSEKVAL